MPIQRAARVGAVRSYLKTKAYDLTAKYYAERHSSDIKNDTPIVSRVLDEWHKHNSGQPHVLDAGCGVGTNLRMFSDRGCLVTGIDTSKQMLRYARLIAPESTLYEIDVRDASEIDGNFDIVFAKALIHLFPYKESYSIGKLLVDKLTDNGILYVTTTLHEYHTESFEPKSDYPGSPVRFRSRWDHDCWTLWLHALNAEPLAQWHNVDPRNGKHWVNAILKKTPPPHID